MTTFATTMADSVDAYISLQHSLGYQFRKQAASLRAFVRYVCVTHDRGPLSQALALDFVMASGLTPNGRVIRYAIIRRFAEYHAAFDPHTEFARSARSASVPFHSTAADSERRRARIAHGS